LTGTLAVAAGAKTIAGTLSAFNTELKVGDKIRVTEGTDTEVMVVDTITSAILMDVVSNSVATYTTGAATRAMVVTGNDDHEVDLEHKHSTNIAAFDSAAESAHQHTAGTYVVNSGAITGTIAAGDSHNHGNGTLYAKMMIDASDNVHYESGGAVTAWNPTVSADGGSMGEPTGLTGSTIVGGETTGEATHTHPAGGASLNATGISGNSGTLVAEHLHSVNPPATDSDNKLSATQSIEPSSNETRFYVRYK